MEKHPHDDLLPRGAKTPLAMGDGGKEALIKMGKRIKKEKREKSFLWRVYRKCQAFIGSIFSAVRRKK